MTPSMLGCVIGPLAWTLSSREGEECRKSPSGMFSSHSICATIIYDIIRNLLHPTSEGMRTGTARVEDQ